MERGRRRGAGREWGAGERGEGSRKKGSRGEIAEGASGMFGGRRKKGKNFAALAVKKENKSIVYKFIVFLQTIVYYLSAQVRE